MYSGNINNDLTINELDVGMSYEGVNEMVAVVDRVNEFLNSDLLGDPFQHMSQAIQSGWQGTSCEAFLANYKNACVKALQSLNDELLELKHNMMVMSDNYMDQDVALAYEMMNEFGGEN